MNGDELLTFIVGMIIGTLLSIVVVSCSGCIVLREPVEWDYEGALNNQELMMEKNILLYEEHRRY